MNLHRKAILVVDDSPLIVNRIIGMLNELETVGPVEGVLSYGDAVESLKENNVDIVFLDIQLGDKNGIDLLKFIRDKYPAITVIMISNQSDDHYRALCKESGAAHFIDKSEEFESIPEVLASFA